MPRLNGRLLQLPLVVMLSALSVPALHAQAPAAVQSVAINIPAQPARTALAAFVEQTRFQLIYAPEVVQGVTTHAVSGNLAPLEALQRLLDGTGIAIVSTGENAATLKKKQEVASLDMVIVTARKKDERLIDVPIALSAISGEDLKRRGASSIAEVLQDAPGVSAFDQGLGTTKISIRGITTSLGGNENGYYLNDLPFTGVNVPIAPDVRAWDIERIEILRGPQGTLFGEGSMGGTVRILTNRPRIGEFSFAGQVSAAATEGGGHSGGEKLMLNLPLGDMLAVRLAATHEKLGGWVDDRATGRSDINRTTFDTGRLAAVFEPTDRLRVDASLWKYRADLPTTSQATDDNQLPPTTVASQTRYLVRGLTANYDFDQAALFYGFSSSSFSLPSSGTFFAGTLRTGIDLRLKTHELRLGSTGKGPLKWTVGFYRREAERREFVDLDVPPINTLVATEVSGSSVFGEASYALPQVPVELTVGLRRFTDRLDRQDLNAGMPFPPAQSRFSSTNPRFSAAWKVTPAWNLYASAAKGFRSGQVQPSAALLLGQVMGVDFPVTLPPDSIWSYEIGTKASLLDSRLFVEAAVYHSDWKDFAVRRPLGNTGVNGIVVSPGTRTDGIEGSLRYEVSHQLGVALQASYSRARFVGDLPGTGIVRGAQVDDVAPVVFGGSLDYSFDAFSAWAGAMHLGYQHNSRRLSPSYPASLPGDAIDNLNARLSLVQGGWTLSLYGENLLNDDGAVSARMTQPVSATQSVAYATRLRPRTIGLEVRYALGR